MDVNALLREFKPSASPTPAGVDCIQRAFLLSQNAHQHQTRKSGEPYFTHSFATGLQLAQWGLDSSTVAAGLLHDVIEDTAVSLDAIHKEFGEEIAFLVDGVTKLSNVQYRGAQEQAENLRKMILALSQDIRVVLIKLADRLHNMKTLGALPPAHQKRIALETEEIYAPLAYRLGMQGVAGELEDLTFPYLHPEEHAWLTTHVKERYDEREAYSSRVRAVLETALRDNAITPLAIDSRAKRYSSLYKKLVRHDMNLEQIYDLVALRVVVRNIEECYAVMGIIHQLWPPMPGRIKDYIALPKPNGYRSLHTTVICLENKPTELQIRTQEMHDEAENGIAAYWTYAHAKAHAKDREAIAMHAARQNLTWVQQLKEWQKGIPGSEEFLQSLKIDFFKDRIFAITPQGAVIDLPAGSTPVDFAYAIHTEIGDQCIGARVNNKIVPLDYAIQSGDLVEILIQKSKKPSESWLSFIKTVTAKRRVRASLRKHSFGRIAPQRVEFKITAQDRVGLLKDISSIISKSHVNILDAHVPRAAHFAHLKITCELIPKEKIEKLLIKLKAIKEIKEISYRVV